jgi:hypothetical protein
MRSKGGAWERHGVPLWRLTSGPQLSVDPISGIPTPNMRRERLTLRLVPNHRGTAVRCALEATDCGQKQRPRVGARGRRKTRPVLCRVPLQVALSFAPMEPRTTAAAPSGNSFPRIETVPLVLQQSEFRLRRDRRLSASRSVGRNCTLAYPPCQEGTSKRQIQNQGCPRGQGREPGG